VNEKQVDVVSMIGSIVFYGDGMHYWECEEFVTKFKLFPCCIRLKPKYCCRVCNECSGHVVNFSIHWSVSMSKVKRLRLISSTEQKDIILWWFYSYNGSCLQYYWNEEIRFNETKSFIFNVISISAYLH